MSSKKYILFIGLLCLMTSGLFAQVGTSYDVLDSSLIPKKRLPQHNEFVNNAYPFPAKPRNQWEIGVKGGLFNVIGDVPSVIPTFGFGAHVRKALGYVVSLRAEYAYGIAKGLNWKQRTAGFNEALQPNALNYSSFYDNYRSNVQDANLQAVFSLNNIRFHKGKTKVLPYALVGVGATWFNTHIDARDESNNNLNYSFADITNNNLYTRRKDVKDALKDKFDGEYETDALTGIRSTDATAGNFAIRPNVNFGAGVAFRLSKRINIALEDRITMPMDDMLDGQRFQNVSAGSIFTKGNDVYNYLTLGLNFNIGSKSVEPLWWLNPLDYAYNELNAPKHMKLPKPILDDADGDGITDQFDLEPNTPANAPVDAHGVSRDTDGDGVPDFRDKELITPTQCQPVDADGVGKCPDPACCQTLDSLMRTGSFRGGCGIGDLPSVSFSGRSVTLSNDAKAVLGSVAQNIRNNPNCKIAVIGYGESSKSAQQLSWDRVNAVINYLVEKEGISSDRFVFKYGEGGGDPNTVDLRDGTGEEGPNTVPAPHPNLRRK